MLQFDIKMMKPMFFDRKLIKNKVDARTRIVLSKFGAYVRRGARRSIRTRRRVSFPGSAPSGHVGTLKRGILFGYDKNRRSVVIGPVRLPSKANSRKTLPGLEFGGRIDLSQGGTAKIKPRPFMNPAFREEISKMPKLWANSIK
jgi:hypothetical protein